MGKHNEKIIIEFWGCPGSGKSTLSTGIVSKLLEEEENILYLQGWIQTQKRKKIIIGLLGSSIKALLLIILSYKLFKKLKIKINIMRILKVYINYCYLIYILRFMKTNIIVSDQGIVQALLSIIYDNKNKVSIDYNIISNLLETFSDNYLFIYTDVSPKILFERIRKRNNNQGRADKINLDENLLKSLYKQKVEFDKLFNLISKKKINTICIDGEDKKENSISKIIELLRKKFFMDKIIEDKKVK